MKIDYRLRKSETPSPTTALLLSTADARELLKVCARLGAHAWPIVHAVSAGYLIKLTSPTTAVWPEVIRLRSLAADLFLPHDAELEPSLLDDEATGLVRSRGLVFLPGGRVLAYSPEQRLTPAYFLTANRLPAHPWRPLPPRPARVEQLREILLNKEDDSPEVILEQGKEGVGEEAPRPPGTGPLATAGGLAAAGLAKGLVGLGMLLGWKGLARAGAKLAQAVTERVPRLSERVLGRQEAALRALLRDFREGNLEEALRRALPLGGSSDRGGSVAQDGQLPWHNLRYALSQLLGSDKSPPSLWLGGLDVQAQLAAEYRKAAEAAAKRGDYRRAAFIYGKLLHDFRQAAGVLERGGLFHDAAILYLEKVGDTLGAARAFAAAGEIDRALRLHRQRGEYLLAGDLLRRAGDEEAALAEYRFAADEMTRHSPAAYLTAGTVLLERAGRPDLALPYFESGWDARPHPDAVSCLLHLAGFRADEDSSRNLLLLLDEASEFLDPVGHVADAGKFYQGLVRLADRPSLASLREDLRDRALLGLANKLRQQSAAEMYPGRIVSELFGQPGQWEAALISDADFAVKALVAKNRTTPSPPPRTAPDRIRLGTGTVTAVCAARSNGILFVGFGDGSIVAFDPTGGIAQVEKPGSGSVLALSTDDTGKMVVALHSLSHEAVQLTNYLRIRFARSPVTYARWAQRDLPSSSNTYCLTPVVNEPPMLGVCDGYKFVRLLGLDLIAVETIEFSQPCQGPIAALLHPFSKDTDRFLPILGFGRREFHDYSSNFDIRDWSPGLGSGNTLYAPSFSWLFRSDNILELACVTENGLVHRLQVKLRGFPATSILNLGEFKASNSECLAAVFVGSQRIAAVRATGIDWLKINGGKLSVSSYTPATLPHAVACFHSPPTQELLVVCSDGELARVSVPH